MQRNIYLARMGLCLRWQLFLVEVPTSPYSLTGHGAWWHTPSPFYWCLDPFWFSCPLASLLPAFRQEHGQYITFLDCKTDLALMVRYKGTPTKLFCIASQKHFVATKKKHLDGGRHLYKGYKGSQSPQLICSNTLDDSIFLFGPQPRLGALDTRLVNDWSSLTRSINKSGGFHPYALIVQQPFRTHIHQPRMHQTTQTTHPIALSTSKRRRTRTTIRTCYHLTLKTRYQTRHTNLFRNGIQQHIPLLKHTSILHHLQLPSLQSAGMFFDIFTNIS